ncbi:HD domain-containing protein [Zavarzinia compransoris]|uniref:Phosphohydrolase n=1 Tax=Zavarzinia compransoris TaxID=1264899 RepID=A0A317EDI8_9PROT|nr:HD domain-containing protein [Zavarzinia compransoris]PWR23423.1 phosphohydrolase [Zavarzinia compransoris]TDP46001.1 putative HD phosphohydrolase [Zavarzinia compransoris]
MPHDGGIDIPKARFHRMDEGTQDDWGAIVQHELPFQAQQADRLLDHLKLLKDEAGGFAIDRLEHSLQAATRAHQAGKDEEYVVCALFHDMGDMLGSYNHADIAAAVLKPFVSERNHWMVEKHGIFQGYYFFHFLGLDRDMREKFRGHPNFEYTAEFCEKFDQNCFDPNFESMPLEAFRPMVQRVISRPRRSIYMKGE